MRAFFAEDVERVDGEPACQDTIPLRAPGTICHCLRGQNGANKTRALCAKRRRNAALTASPLNLMTGTGKREGENPLLCVQLAATEHRRDQSRPSGPGTGEGMFTPRAPLPGAACAPPSPGACWLLPLEKVGRPLRFLSHLSGSPEAVTSGTVLCQDLRKGRGSV